jgi:hypothetical protein
MGNLPKNGNLLIEAKGFAGSWNDIGISISQYSFLPIDIYSGVFIEVFTYWARVHQILESQATLSNTSTPLVSVKKWTLLFIYLFLTQIFQETIRNCKVKCVKSFSFRNIKTLKIGEKKPMEV